jgi:hypothetical protein
VFNNPENIRLAIIIIQYLINHNFIIDNNKHANANANVENKQILQFLITAINEIFEYIQLQKTSLTNDFILLQKMQDSFKKRDAQINNIDIVINGIFRQYPQLYISSKKHQIATDMVGAAIAVDNSEIKNYEMKKIIHAIINYIKENNLTAFNHTMINTKLLKHLLISDGCIRNLGGIKEIKLAYLKFTKGHTNAPEIIQLANSDNAQNQKEAKKESAM